MFEWQKSQERARQSGPGVASCVWLAVLAGGGGGGDVVSSLDERLRCAGLWRDDELGVDV